MIPQKLLQKTEDKMKIHVEIWSEKFKENTECSFTVLRIEISSLFQASE
jgi:hypothetical protein